MGKKGGELRAGRKEGFGYGEKLMIGWILKKILGTQNQREVRRLAPMVGEIHRHEEALP